MSHRKTQVWIAFHHSKAGVHPLAFVVGLPSQNTIQVCASVSRNDVVMDDGRTSPLPNLLHSWKQKDCHVTTSIVQLGGFVYYAIVVPTIVKGFLTRTSSHLRMSAILVAKG